MAGSCRVDTHNSVVAPHINFSVCYYYRSYLQYVILIITIITIYLPSLNLLPAPWVGSGTYNLFNHTNTSSAHGQCDKGDLYTSTLTSHPGDSSTDSSVPLHTTKRFYCHHHYQHGPIIIILVVSIIFLTLLPPSVCP